MNKSDLTQDQKRFIDWFHRQDSRLLKLTGYAGSGKTSVLDFLGWNGTVYYCALSNQAKNVLAGKVRSKRVFTIASLLGYRPIAEKGKIVFKKGAKSRIDCDDEPLLVVDESSMIDESTLRDLVNTRASRILFVGDNFQIPPIDYTKSPIYSEEYSHVPTFTLTEIVRQANDSPILKLANGIRKGDDEWDIPEIEEITLTKSNIANFYSKPGIRVAVCPTHVIKNFCNSIARRVNNKNIDPIEPFVIGEQFFLESPILDYAQNGDIVRITSVPKVVEYNGFNLIKMTVDDKCDIMTPFDLTESKKVKDYYRHLEYMYSKAVTNQAKAAINAEVEELSKNIIFGGHGYSRTVHTSQGSTIPHVLFCAQSLEHFGSIYRNMIYTAITRASESVTIGFPP